VYNNLAMPMPMIRNLKYYLFFICAVSFVNKKTFAQDTALNFTIEQLMEYVSENKIDSICTYCPEFDYITCPSSIFPLELNMSNVECINDKNVYIHGAKINKILGLYNSPYHSLHGIYIIINQDTSIVDTLITYLGPVQSTLTKDDYIEYPPKGKRYEYGKFNTFNQVWTDTKFREVKVSYSDCDSITTRYTNMAVILISLSNNETSNYADELLHKRYDYRRYMKKTFGDNFIWDMEIRDKMQYLSREQLENYYILHDFSKFYDDK